jgi:amino acid transporter
VLFGRPLASERIEQERLSKRTALAVLSSDAISSVAYATDQILFVVAVLGAAALSYVVPISAVIVGLLVLVGLSYRQTIFAYPGGGGSYTVARDNLGARAGLVAAAALLTDYILTVAVSISGGVAAITSAYPSLAPHAVTIGVGAIALLAVVNLRGVRESGAAFSVPTYAFIAMMLLLLGVGLLRLATGHGVAPVPGAPVVDPVSLRQHGSGASLTGVALAYLLLRGFAEGCAAMTGTEAISNGVTVFRQPAPRNAAATLGWMVAILAAFFLGVSVLAERYAVFPTAGQTVLSQLGRHVFGGGPLYYALQYATFAVLVLAANTAFADFPRLASILAGDRYMPRQLAARGDRLAFSNGIVALAVLAALLVWSFGGNTNALVPLYAVGVFVCFTLSQAGMVVHWRRTREPGWRARAALNGVGAAATAVVSLIQIVTKFTAGGWIVVLLVPALVWLLTAIHAHYARFARDVAFTGQSPITPLHHTVVVPVNGITKATAGALVYATTISDDVRVVSVEVDPAATAGLVADWAAWDVGLPLVVLPSPFRSVLRPLVDYVEGLGRTVPGELVSVVVPEIVPDRWWQHLLHNKTAFYIRTAFLFRANVVVISVPYMLGHTHRLRDLLAHDDSLESDGATEAVHPRPRHAVARGLALALLLPAAMALQGCRSRMDDAATNTPAARRLVGAWDLRAHLDRSGPLAQRKSAGRDVRGEIALVPNHWVGGGDAIAEPTHVGAFDADFSPFGIEPRDAGAVPGVLARVTRGADGRDSVLILLAPDGGQGTLRLAGAWSGDSVVGRWIVDSEHSARGGSGSFVMTRHSTR